MAARRIGGKRRHVVLSPVQDTKLEKLADATAMTEAEHIRRAMDAYFRLLEEAELRRRAARRV